MRFRRRENKQSLSSNRINFFIAIIFLFGAVILYRMYDLQISKYDLYIAKADGQHQVFNKLLPERGDIFIEDFTIDGGRAIYPFATNKEFAHIFAVPTDIDDADDIAIKFFNIFDREKVREEVEKYFSQKDQAELDFQLSLIRSLPEEERLVKEREIRLNLKALWADKSWREEREDALEYEIEKRSKDYLVNYTSKLTKKNDPYEPIRDKVDEETLKNIYATLLSSDKNIVATSTLVLKEGQIFKKTSLKDDNVLELVTYPGVSHVMKEYRYYPENNIGSHLSGFVSLRDDSKKGYYGLEGFFDTYLAGKPGEVKSERGAKRDIIIVNDREYNKPENGSDLLLSINRSIQFVVCQKLAASIKKHQADSGTVIAVEPKTGAIIAMCSFPDYDPNNYNQVEDIDIYNNPAVFEEYEPGSVFKTITIASSIDAGKITPGTFYQDNGSIMIDGWNKPLRNSDFATYGAHGWVDMNYVLTNSLNTGSIFAMLQVGDKDFSKYVSSFGFGERTGLELEGEGIGNIKSLLRNPIRPVEAATASFGQGITATPLQMLMSYAAIANNGILMKPYIVREIVHEDGSSDVTRPIQIRRVISEQTADLVLGMLANVVEGGHASLAAVPGYYIGGKTGTAQVASSDKKGYSDTETIHNFIGVAPVNDPKFVMLVKLDSPRDADFSASTAAPLFGEIADYILNYYKVPKTR